MPNTKEQTLDEIAEAWHEFQGVLQNVPQQHMEEPGLEGQWSTKDIVGHVTTWEVEMMRVIHSYMGTEDSMVLPYGDVDAFNHRTVAEKRTRPLVDLLDEMHQTHHTTVEFVESMEEPLFDTAQVERRVRIDLYDHYREHTEQISRWLNRLGG